MTDQPASADLAETGRTARPRVIAVTAVFGCNGLLAAALIGWALIANPTEWAASPGEDWSGLIAVIGVIFAAGLLTATTAAGAAVAWRMMTRRMVGSPAPTHGAAVLVGLGATAVGWLVVSVAAVVVWVGYTFVTTS